jgi:predicted DNA-binding antitoxin AbrB/MazE fold protein
MTLAVDAIFENGVLKPLNPLALAEQQKVHLIVETNAAAAAPAHAQWHWAEAQAIQDGFAGAVADEVGRQRREG